ncbi:hypothetical protein [Flavobacterium sp. 3-210]
MTRNEQIALIATASDVMQYYIDNEDIKKAEYKDHVYFDNAIFDAYFLEVTKTELVGEKKEFLHKVILDLPIFTRTEEFAEADFLGLVKADLEKYLKQSILE